MDDHITLLLTGEKLQKPFANDMDVRVLHFSKWVSGKITKVNRDNTFSVSLNGDSKTISVPRTSIRHERSSCNSFQATLDKKRRVCLSASTVDSHSEGCTMHQARSSSAIAVGVWTHVAFVIIEDHENGCGSVTTYLDGIADGEVTFNGLLLKSSNELNFCGSISEKGPASMIKDVKIIPKALTTFHIIDLMSLDILKTEASRYSRNTNVSTNLEKATSAVAETLQVLDRSGDANIPDKVEEVSKYDKDDDVSTTEDCNNRKKSPSFDDNDYATKLNDNSEENLNNEANLEISLTLAARLTVAKRIAEQQAQVVDINALSNRGKLITYICNPPNILSSQGAPNQLSLLKKGAVVQGRVGSRWYPGKIHAINADSSVDVCFDDNDFRPSVPSDRIRILLKDGSWVLAFDVSKHSMPEMQEKLVLNRKPLRKLRQLRLSMNLALQTIYCEHIMHYIVSAESFQNVEQSRNPSGSSSIIPKTMLNFSEKQILLVQFLRVAVERPMSVLKKIKQMSNYRINSEKTGLTDSILQPPCGNAQITETSLDLVRPKILKSLAMEKLTYDKSIVLPSLFMSLVSECMGHLLLSFRSKLRR